MGNQAKRDSALSCRFMKTDGTDSQNRKIKDENGSMFAHCHFAENVKPKPGDNPESVKKEKMQPPADVTTTHGVLADTTASPEFPLYLSSRGIGYRLSKATPTGAIAIPRTGPKERKKMPTAENIPSPGYMPDSKPQKTSASLVVEDEGNCATPPTSTPSFAQELCFPPR